MPPLRSLLLSLAGALLSCSLSIAQESAPTVRIVGRVDENSLVTLRGNTNPSARAQFDRGPVDPGLRMDGLVLVLARSPEQQAEFDKFVAGQSDPSSPNYHHWLEPEEVGERFGPAQSDIDVIENWLRGHDLTVGALSKDRMSIHFGGTAAQIESTFHTEIHNLDVKGEKHIANMSDPRIPAALAPVVAGPKALHNFIPRPLHRLGGKVTFNREKGAWQPVAPEEDADGRPAARPRPQLGVNDPNNGLHEDVTPYDFATIYNVLPAWNDGIDGAGQTIAVAGTSEIEESDLATFRSQFGLPAISSFTQKVANGIDPGVCTSTDTSLPCNIDDLFENSLDVQWSGAVAKGAGIVLVVSGNNSAGSIDTVYDSAQFVVDNKTAPVLNVSYGLCEMFEGTAGNTSYKNLWETASTEGIAVFVATGDSGSATCDGAVDTGAPYAAEYGLSISGVASTPYDTAVGGTDFLWCDPVENSSCTGPAATYWNSANSANKSNARGYIPEIPWNDTCVSKIGIEEADYWNNQLYDAGAGPGNTPGDAEQSCNFYANWAEVIVEYGGPDLSFFVNVVGGSGGRSTCTISDGQDFSTCTGGYGKPTWQAGIPGISPDGRRDIPDVSFFASPGTLSNSAYLVCVSAAGSCTYSATAENTDQEIGGTSAASPAMAGVMALINQKAGGPWGSPNAELYSLAAKQNYSSCSAETVTTSSGCYFNDIDKETNAQACDFSDNSPNCAIIHSGDELGVLPGFPGTLGYDLATGLGSLNVANIVNVWPATPVAAVTLSSASLTFAGTAKGTSSAAQTITLKNTGHGALSLAGTGNGIEITGVDATSFSQTNTCGSSVAIGASCLIHVVFKPLATGTLTASLSIGDNAFGSPQTVSLSGLGALAVAKLSSTTVTFGPIPVGKTSFKQNVTLKNTGNAALTISSIAITGGNPNSFSQTNNCGASVAIGRYCTITVGFKPQKLGALTANVSITDKASGSPQEIVLKGTGSGPIAFLSAGSLAFPATTVGKAAPTQNFTLSNLGNYVLGKPGGGVLITITGTNPNSFTETDNCDNHVAPGGKCTITVKFVPKKTGPLAANVTFTDNAVPSPQEVKLTGTGQ